MQIVPIQNAEEPHFKAAWEIYREAFPPDESRTVDQQRRLLRDPAFHFDAIQDGAECAGLIEYWDLGEFRFLDHFAVSPNLRGKGIGRLALELFLTQDARLTVLEVEPLETGAAAVRRVEFYRRSGFELNSYEYVQPSLGEGKNPVRLLIMSRPGRLDTELYRSVRSRLYREVYQMEAPVGAA